MTLNEVLKNTNYELSLFSEEGRNFVEGTIFVKTVRGKETPFITCQKRNKEIVLKPEEAVRQLYLYKLIHEYGYPTSRIEVEFPIHFGREVKRADIAIMDKDRPMVPYIVVELKKPKEWFRKLHESRRQNSVLWFLDFVYRLRNALFHEIIDPLDEEWQAIFKNAYLVLKEIVDLNIAAIDTINQKV